jgi:hypothetical protein
MAPRLQDLWRWLVTILDDVFVEKFWIRLRRGNVRGAVRSIAELITGFPGCWLILAGLALLVLVVVRSL